jgi:hypothetical protein
LFEYVATMVVTLDGELEQVAPAAAPLPLLLATLAADQRCAAVAVF